MMELCKTPWLKPECSNWITNDFLLPNGELFLCMDDLENYFEYQKTDQIRLVAYDRPGKFRYCVKFGVKEGDSFLDSCVDLIIDGEQYYGGFYQAFKKFLVRIHKRFGKRKLYVECEIK